MLSVNIYAQAQKIEFQNYDWDVKASIHKMNESEMKESAVVIKDVRETEYAYDNEGMLEEFYSRHRIIHINESGAVEEHNRIYIPVTQPDQLLVFKARSVAKNGKVIEKTKSDMKEITEEGRTYLIIAVDGLEKDGEL